MASSIESPSASGRHIALLIDADNVSHTKIDAIITELSKYGTPNIRRAYGDWTSNQLSGWRGKLHEFAIRPIQQFPYSTGKNATDISLVIEAMELLYTQRLDGFAIASSDADFTPLVMHLKATGHQVIGFGERKTPEPFVAACSTFLFLDTLGLESGGDAPLVKSATVQSDPVKGAPVKGAPVKPTPAKPAAKQSAKSPRQLAQDTKLVSVLRGAVAAAARDDGWALLATAGSAAKRQAPIDPQNYGVKNFPALFEATGLFEIVRDAANRAFIADRRNADRAAKPFEMP